MVKLIQMSKIVLLITILLSISCHKEYRVNTKIDADTVFYGDMYIFTQEKKVYEMFEQYTKANNLYPINDFLSANKGIRYDFMIVFNEKRKIIETLCISDEPMIETTQKLYTFFPLLKYQVCDTSYKLPVNFSILRESSWKDIDTTKFYNRKVFCETSNTIKHRYKNQKIYHTVQFTIIPSLYPKHLFFMNCSEKICNY